MKPLKIFFRILLRIVIVIALVLLAAALRIWPLQDLELRLAYLTFYPAVMIAALYGGVFSGLLTTILSALTILFWSPTGQPFIKDSSDWLGMAVFLVNCIMISLISEAMLRAKARAKRAQEQAEAANHAKSLFLSTMSHELRTPLNAILGFSNLMRNDAGLTAEQLDNLDIINRSGEHLLSLINDVLDMAKIEAGRIVLDVQPFDLGALVLEVTEMLKVRATEKGLSLQLDQSSMFPRFVKSDKEKLRQILVNLISNAIKYTHQGGVILRLGIQMEKEALRLIIEVEDTGVGISVEDQPRIFDPFVQVGMPSTHKGTGLGLAIVRDFVKLMNGTIHVQSALTQGTLFTIIIPVQQVDAAEVVLPDTDKGRVIGLESGQSEYRILIVEDQQENWLLLQRLLEDVGFVVKVAKNGEEGVAMFQSFHPHFIWMDRRMPIMDGLEATRRIRALAKGKEVKIAAVTASALVEQREEILAAGMDDFLRKPYHAAEIFDCLAKHLGVRFLYDQALSIKSKTEISAPALAKLPDILRSELLDSLVLGNIERLDLLIPRIEQQDAELAKVLTYYLDNFNYLPILKALEITETNSRKLQNE